MDNDNPNSVLKQLIETARDGEKGFREAAEHLKSPELRTMAQRVSSERAEFARELEPELRAAGKDEKIEGSMGGALHRAWVDIKTALGGGDQTILDWLEQGEDHAKRVYADALKASLPTALQVIVRRQNERVRSVHDQVKMLRDQNRAA